MNPDGTTSHKGSDFNIKPVTVAIILALTIGITIVLNNFASDSENQSVENNPDTSLTSLAYLFEDENVWIAPDTASIPQDDSGKLISYGRNIVIHTSKYFGPKGSLDKSTNGLTCQNCHFEAGTRPYGNNFGAVAATYPRFMPRFGAVHSIATKVNECFMRSLNGNPIDTAGKEMNAIVAYINWLGKDVRKGETPAGSGGIKAPHFIARAADPEKGKIVYEQMCSRCHGSDGEGQFAADILKDETKQQGGNATADDLYYYPPVWGSHSYNGVATLYRLSKFAGFVQNNMPYPMTYKNPVLTDEQAWDVAAYVNSLERPIKDHSKDYASDISKKPFDFPFGPYADNFAQEQHKFGPYTDMPSAKHKK
jgi:thiosulfate dehydrogenase